jgi:hypothetical protein
MSKPSHVKASKSCLLLRHSDAGRIHLRGLQAEPLLLAAWSAIGVGAARGNGMYNTPSIVLVSLGTLCLVAAAAFPTGSSPRSNHHLDWGLPIGAAVFTAVALPAGILAAGFQMYLGHALTALCAVGLAVPVVLQTRMSRPYAYALIGVMTWAGVAMILADQNPYIDVWSFLQATAHGLSHGVSMYKLQWAAPPGQSTNVFPYLPGGAVLLWPFFVLFGDVRYGELAALVLTSLLLTHCRRDRTGLMLGCLVLLYPRVLMGLEQSWIEPLIVLEIGLAAYACARGRKTLAIVAFAAALVTKQQVWLLLPMAVVWEEFGWRRTLYAVGGAVAFIVPWYVVAPAGFVQGTLLYNLRLPARLDSLSLFTTAILHNIHPSFALVGILTLAAIGLALWRGGRDTQGFLVGAAMVEAVFNLANKQSFYNEWELAAGLALLAVGFGYVEPTYASGGSSSGDSSAAAPTSRGPSAIVT